MHKIETGNTVILRFSTEEIQRLFNHQSVKFPMSELGGPEGLYVVMEHGGTEKDMDAALHPIIKKDNPVFGVS